MVLAFRNVRVREIVEALDGVNYWLLLVALGLQLFGYVLMAARWQVLIGANPVISVHRLLSLLLIGQLANTVLVVRTGPLIRAVLLRHEVGLDYATSLTTVFVEKVIDVLILTGIFLVLIPFVPSRGWMPYAQTVTSATVLLLILVCVWLLLRHQSVLRRILRAIIERVPWLGRSGIVKHFDAAIAYLAGLHWRRVLPSLLSYSSLLWLVGTLITYLVMLAMGLDVPYLASVLLLVILQLGARLPAAPGNLGVFHYLCIIVLSLFLVDKGTALSYSFVLYAIVYLPSLLLGLVYLMRYAHVR